MSGRDDERKKQAPSFSGYSMPMNVNLAGLDEGVNETTRRVAFQPSFEPISAFRPPSLGETQSAAPAKAAPARASETKGIWKIHDVQVLPQYHLLERTAVFVPNASPSDVSMRVSEVLRERSIQATYDDEKAKASCITEDGVDFRVRLYRGRGKFGHGVIVEVQRRFGTSNTFYSAVSAILDAAEGKVTPPPPLLSANLPLVSDDDEEESVGGASSLLMIANMLNHPSYDTHFLALQMLASLTDASKMGAGTARSVATELLRLDDSNEVGSKVLSLVIDKKGDEDVFKLRSIAFQAVANAFQSVNGNVPQILKEQLRTVLIDELRKAEKTPRLAVQAARIVEFLVPEDTGSDLHSALEMAFNAGMTRHASLERQARLCLNKLE